MPTADAEIRLILVDDHPLVRDGLRTRLEAVPQFRVVGEAGDGEQALQLAGEKTPDIALVDIGLRGMSGIELTRRLASEFPAVSVLMLSMYDNHEYVVQAVRAGARGYVLKDSPAEEVVTAIQTVARGGTFYSAAVMAAVTQASAAPLLTQREQQVLSAIVDGKSNKEIAKHLGLSVRTVETHRQNIKHKLGVDSAADLVKYALKMGLTKL